MFFRGPPGTAFPGKCLDSRFGGNDGEKRLSIARQKIWLLFLLRRDFRLIPAHGWDFGSE
jgi:hypothetical protein